MSGEVDVNGTAAAQDRIVFWRYNPYLFVIEVLGAKPLSYREQNEVAKVVTTQQRQVLEDVGKPFLKNV